MKVALYGRPIRTKNFDSFFGRFAACLRQHNIEFEAIGTYKTFLQNEYNIECNTCDDQTINPKNYTCLISLGGDGTMLDTLAIVRKSGLPVLGINLGRLGFLADIKMQEFEAAILAIKSNDIVIETRSVLELNSNITAISDFSFALNDFVVQKRDSSAMITVKTYLDNDYLNNYWADGLIISTPTGSSGYSLSCGGPIIFPGSQAFVITPIAAHNLTVRPVVVPDSNTIHLEIKGRSKDVLVSLDSRSFKVPNNTKLSIKRADFNFNLIRPKGSTYMDTLRNKLLWGADKRDENL